MPEQYYYTFRVNPDGTGTVNFETHKEDDKPEAQPLEKKPVEPVKVPLSQLDLMAEWNRFRDRFGYWDYSGFRMVVQDLISDPQRVYDIEFCHECGNPGLDHTEVTGIWVCPTCITAYGPCGACGELARYMTGINGEEVCRPCRDNIYTWCDPCGVWFPNDDPDEEHNHGGPNCKCESPPEARHFYIRNDGNEPLANDQLTTVTLPKGDISDEGMEQIAYTIRKWARREFQYHVDYAEVRAPWYTLAARLNEVGHKWQAKQGNFTKRLSRFAYKELQLKVPPELVSEIGNLASQHSGGAEYRVAFTRDLNQSPDQYANYDSCWWGSYAASRCTLKSNGGFALRTFQPPPYERTVTGRAWVIPMRLAGRVPDSGDLVPTFETLDADAFIVFNPYGEMHGYIPARIMAHLAGMTYRKVGFAPCSESVMYVNNESGYLVAPEAIADFYNDGDLDISLEVHSNLFEREMKMKEETSDVA